MRAERSRGATATASAAVVGEVPDRIDWLVDNAIAYRAVLDAIGRARRSVWITQLAFDADCVAYESSDGRHPQPAPSLLDALIEASNRRGVAVRIVLNETLLLDTVPALRTALAARGATDVIVRGVRRFPQLLHAKMLIVDEREAFLLGSPFVNGYWDDARHLPVDARRPARELGGRPLHDLSARLVGSAVTALSVVFAELWNEVSSGADADAPIECRPPRPVESPHTGRIRIVRTAPVRSTPRTPHGSTDILSDIEGALECARRHVYVEHQYLSSRRVIAALVRALAREPSLEVVIVLNQNPDVTAYRNWQNARLGEAGLFDHPRVGVFALWRATPVAGPSDWTVNQLFVHSKVLLVDDEWLTTGSANLDGVSLHSYGHDFTGWLGRRLFDGIRNFDVNATVCGEPGERDPSVLALRTALWSEHLALPPSTIRAVLDGEWLALWRERARASVTALGRPPRTPRAREALAMVLPYSRRPTPRAQLGDVGVRASARLDVPFDPTWLEVHFSPNWVRNMFA